ncbi:acyl carrier protein [Vibrio furnissii NCTC 11218]|nr:acyl carrier protein [Vibrio furnissii NCTC 11218]
MSHLGVISMFDMEFSKSITNADLKQINSVFDLAKLAGIE